MGHRPFNIPIFLKLDSVANYCANSPWEALDYLDVHWPGARTEKFERARAVCQLAIDGWVDPEVARDAVIAAARECQVLERSWRSMPAGILHSSTHA